jgi:hypothetical protein
MRRSRLACGNGHDGQHDNHSVHVIAELMDVIRDLCRSAAVFRLAGRLSGAEALIEQCGDLLVHRARLLAGSREGARRSQPTFETNAATTPRGTKWTN